VTDSKEDAHILPDDRVSQPFKALQKLNPLAQRSRPIEYVRRNRYDLIFALLVIVAFAWRLIPLLERGAPTGADWANDLVVGHSFLGNTVGNQGITYPPLIPLVLALLNTIIPISILTSFIAATAAVLPYVGVYLALRSFGPELAWVIAPLPLLIASSTSEMMAFGGAPQLIASACMPIVMVSAALLFDQPTKRRAIAFGVSLFLLAATSHLVLGQAFVALAFLLIIETASDIKHFLGKVRRSAKYFALGLLPLVLLVPIYVSLIPQLGLSQTIGAKGALSPLARLQFLTREDRPFWYICLFASMLVAYFAVSQRHTRLGLYVRAALSTLITALLFLLFTSDIRFSYLLPTAICFSLALVAYFVTHQPASLWVHRINALITVAFLGSVALQFASASTLLTQQINFYGSLTVSSLDLRALNYIKSDTSPKSLFAVTSVTQGNNPVGWWVEGYSERPALVQGSDSFLFYASQKKDSRIATDIFRSFPSATAFKVARSFKVNYLVVFRKWAQYNAVATEYFAHSHPSLVVFSNADILIVKVPHGPSTR
jgi:hypothetical protein